VFNEIVAKQLKARGYYDDKYWSQVKVSKGITFVTENEEERRYRDKVNTMEDKMQCMNGVMKLWLAVMSQKYPNDDLIKKMERALHDEVSLHGSICRSPSLIDEFIHM
jgi:phosphoribosylformylglycinamidine (FGAM) synthase PurS component